VNLKVAEPRDLHVLALYKMICHHFKKSINKVLGFTLVQAQLVKQRLMLAMQDVIGYHNFLIFPPPTLGSFNANTL